MTEMPRIEIREATDEDSLKVLMLLQQCFIQQYATAGYESRIGNRRFEVTEDQITSLLAKMISTATDLEAEGKSLPKTEVTKKDYFVCATRDEEIVGTTLGYKIGDLDNEREDQAVEKAYFEGLGYESAWYVKSVYVKSGNQRKGIGSYLMDLQIRAALKRSATRLILEVTEYNSDAIAFYKKMGMKIREGVYREVPLGGQIPLPLIIMELDLTKIKIEDTAPDSKSG